LTNCVDVRINDVRPGEIDSLSTIMNATTAQDEFLKNVELSGRAQNYVVTVKTGELPELKNALRMVLQVVRPERIDIEPWNGPSH